MFPNVNPTKTKAWQALTEHFNEVKDLHLKNILKDDSKRFEKYTLQFEDILVDLSKNRITDETVELLLDLAKETKIDEAIKAMFAGEFINKTETRAVLHSALRNRSNTPVCFVGKDVMPDEGES